VPRNQMTCREFVGLIRAHRDGELGSADRQSFSQHSGKCARCSDYLNGYQRTINAAKRIRGDSLDTIEAVMPISLVRRILDHRLKAPE
jgi:hypothetical protein